jgi:hypothetical protein
MHGENTSHAPFVGWMDSCFRDDCFLVTLLFIFLEAFFVCLFGFLALICDYDFFLFFLGCLIFRRFHELFHSFTPFVLLIFIVLVFH